MARSGRFAEAFLAARPGAADAQGTTLAPLLERVWDDARAAWPGVPLAPAVFARHVAERIPQDADPAAAVRALHAADLYLACACLSGEPAAVAAFERDFMAQVTVYLERRDALAGFTDDLKQALRERLLVAPRGLLPRIASYTGRGPLGAWLRVAAVREAIDLRRKRKHGGAPMPDEALLPGASDPELDYLRRKYGSVVREAIASALRSLEPREATVLRLFFLQGLTLEAIGSLYRTSKRTARRWVADARQKIVDETRARLADRLQVSTAQLDSLIRLVKADIEPSIVKMLKNSRPR